MSRRAAGYVNAATVLLCVVLMGSALAWRSRWTTPWPRRCMALTVEAGQVKRVIDGDTYVLYTVGLTDEEHVRMLGGDAWELRDPLGPAARDSAGLWLHRGAFTIASCRRDSFGRLLAWTVRNGDSLHIYLRERGLLKP